MRKMRRMVLLVDRFTLVMLHVMLPPSYLPRYMESARGHLLQSTPLTYSPLVRSFGTTNIPEALLLRDIYRGR
jgi:hypothetical protein